MPRELIRRLYEREALGVLDEELVDEVAFAFYARCRSIIRATEAARGHAACGACEHIIEHSVRGAEVLRCDRCGWEITWREYRSSFQGKYLITGNPGGAFTEYPRRLEAVRTPQERMLAIDWLVHQVHSWTLDREQPIGRPTAVNLIEGNETKVVAFLDELAAGLSASPEEKESYSAWRRTLWLESERHGPGAGQQASQGSSPGRARRVW
ncbi:MAG: hypothetical protein WEE64_02140 [Dehalococcoidia bacterium]